jgi:hypothetical protein
LIGAEASFLTAKDAKNAKGAKKTRIKTKEFLGSSLRLCVLGALGALGGKSFDL